MIDIATLAGVADSMTSRQLAGWIVKDLIPDHGMTVADAARSWHLARPTLHRLIRGDSMSEVTYRAVERGLGLPRGFLRMVVVRDVAKIRRVQGIDESLRAFVLSELGFQPNGGHDGAAVRDS
jgi:hypothetical protein